MQKKAKFFKALGDETRLKIVSHLLDNETCACDFAYMTKKDQTTVSRHLKVLTDAGILENRRDGRNIIYKIRNDEIKNVLESFGLKNSKSKYCIESKNNER